MVRDSRHIDTLTYKQNKHRKAIHSFLTSLLAASLPARPQAFGGHGSCLVTTCRPGTSTAGCISTLGFQGSLAWDDFEDVQKHCLRHNKVSLIQLFLLPFS